MNSFSVRFTILLTLCHTYCCTWPTVTKALATPTNSNAHVSPVGSKVMRCVRGIQCEYVHLVHLRMHTPHTVSALGPPFSRPEKQMARLHVPVGMCKLSSLALSLFDDRGLSEDTLIFWRGAMRLFSACCFPQSTYMHNAFHLCLHILC